MQYDLIAREVLYDGFFALERLRLRFQRYDGSWSPEIARELFERGHAVAVLPYDPQRDEVVLIEQFRPGALDAPTGPWMVEIVAGMIEVGESPVDVARRESVEESGLSLQKVVPITRYWVSPGGTSESIYLYLGVVDASEAGGLYGLEHEHEDIRVSAVPLDEALSRVEQGTICSAAPIIALQWLALNRERLFAG